MKVRAEQNSTGPGETEATASTAGPKWARVHLTLVRLLLILTSTAKLVSIAGEQRFLAVQDPVLYLTNRAVLLIAALMELGVAAYLTWGRDMRLKHGCVVWLASTFLVYRLALWVTSPGSRCLCLGWVGDLLLIPPHLLDYALVTALVLMLVGSAWRLRAMRSAAEVPSAPSGSVSHTDSGQG
ncbi:MAG: hypothetical protein WHT82_14335 [Limisphaera sp.]